tara:strand:- start:1674 stop:2447 length:774 start_codon:yes stop_codon:yes gene_type:complete
MALDFAAQIHALTGFDADSTDDSETGDDYDELTAQWMSDAIKEVINVLPPHLLEQTAVIESNQNMNDGDGHDVEGKILNAFRALNSSFLDGQVYECRRIPFTSAFKAVDPESVEYATPTDPVYYIEPQSDNSVGELHIRPKDTGQNVSKVVLAHYPTFVAGGSGTYDVSTATTIANFPNEAEYLVVLRAAVFAAQYQLAIEEDDDLYEPIIDSLSKKYEQGITALLTKKLEPAAKSKGKGLDLGKALAGLGGLGGAK